MINERFHQGVGRPKSLFGFSDGHTRSAYMYMLCSHTIMRDLTEIYIPVL